MIKFRPLKDMTDHEFRNWIVVARAPGYRPPASNGQAMWRIRCQLCNATKNVLGQEIRRDQVAPCRHTDVMPSMILKVQEPISDEGKHRILELLKDIDSKLSQLIKLAA